VYCIVLTSRAYANYSNREDGEVVGNMNGEDTAVHHQINERYCNEGQEEEHIAKSNPGMQRNCSHQRDIDSSEDPC
jgi:hypothetical protein